MKLTEKLEILQTNHMNEFLKAREKAWTEVSMEHPMFCVCRSLCTGLHENNCRKFQNKVTSRAVKNLKYLLVEEIKK